MTHIKDASDMLHFFRFAITETAASTFTEIEINTNIPQGSIGLIHLFEVQFEPDMVELPQASASEEVNLQVCRSTQSGIIDLNDPDLLVKMHAMDKRYADVGTAADAPRWLVVNPDQWFYNPPIPFVASSLFVGLLSQKASAVTLNGRIGYTLATVPDKVFFSLAISGC